MHVLHPFPPVWNKESRVLVLGSFPSVKSRDDGFYYAHPRNRFWPIMSAVFGVEAKTVEEKTSLLLTHNIALWDAAAECTIEGSSDSALSAISPNDIIPLIAGSSIKTIIANGTKAYEIYMALSYPDTGIEAVKMPSTSPANASWSWEKLLKAWKNTLLEALNETETQ